METTDTHVSGMFQGTLTHMSPEVLLEGRVSKAADVYSYGMGFVTPSFPSFSFLICHKQEEDKWEEERVGHGMHVVSLGSLVPFSAPLWISSSAPLLLGICPPLAKPW